MNGYNAASKTRAVAAPALDHRAFAPFLLITGHDYRTAKQVHLHHYAKHLARYGRVGFFSIGFSGLSWLNRDSRLPLWSRSNKTETVDGVDCYLWRTPIHPFNLRHDAVNSLLAKWFTAYGRNPPDSFRNFVADSRYVIIESGLGIALFETVKRVNPRARVVYFASDDLASIGCSPVLHNELVRTIHRYDAVFSLSKRLARLFAGAVPTYYVPYGTDQIEVSPLSPYAGGFNAVTAGSSSFDPSFFNIAAVAFPEITFHLIGCGPKAARLRLSNVRIYPEMPFLEVLRYFKHAQLGIAPYAGRNLDLYLAESSQKLTHFSMLAVPAVCPQAAAGDVAGRFGYIPDDPKSIVSAVRAALACGPFPGAPLMQWSDIVDRLLTPEAFADTQV